ncbi:uncharacterized protein N7469_006557 [Penicillium citrinum]|uniref:DUF829-domain-containing protein n=1 Tax=Penicillium citrinum TaxID=5077 RepID=A0A9W9TKW1_PENCI|nr:uncharacterized protein N7469_006557 [Penicillium citrinum]KAJ5226551.1 hypothetical protein N7469_006557 [Penicillium citrinum]KAK5790866.1 hypothetical protein VI817_006175 [Penicillium citrinum]
MAPRPLPFPGFTPISDRVYLRNGHEKARPALAHEPTTIVIFGWGDGMPKNVSKYADGYHELFPNARIVAVLSKTFHASNQPLDDRIEAMLPVIDTVFPTPTGSGNGEERVLLHAMSNTGGIFLAAAFTAYQKRHGSDKTLPHTLLVCDSTPGSLDFASQVGRWSRAMAVGTSKYFPWPFIVTQALWYMFLWANYAWELLRGTEPSGVWATRVMNDHSIAPIETNRLYLYSKEDEIIWWEDLENAVADVKSLGYNVDLEMFEGSPHVGHMRLHPEQYWGKISRSWNEALPTR